MVLNLNWDECRGSKRHNLLTLDLYHKRFNTAEGVFVVWHEDRRPETVSVGQGFLRDRLALLRHDPDVLAFKPRTLYVAWAPVVADHRPGVQNFLVERLKPKLGKTIPKIRPVRVNLPWEKRETAGAGLNKIQPGRSPKKSPHPKRRSKSRKKPA